MAVLRVGFASADITPSVGTPLGGYLARPQFEAQGVHDPLFAKAIAISDGSQLVLLYSLDLLGFTPARSAALSQAVATACSLEPEQIVLACTHTHSGPNTLPLRGIPDVDESYFEQLAQRMQEAGKEALAALRPATMQVALGRSHVGVNRRSPVGQSINLRENPQGVYDDALLVLRFLDICDDKLLGVVTCYGCHLTALGPKNMLISAEWAGLAMNSLQQQLGCLCLFLNGAFGNVNPRNRDETWSRTEEIAETFAQDCLATLAEAHEEESTPVSLERMVVQLPLAPLAPEDEIHRLRLEASSILSGPPVDEASRRVAEVRRQYADAVERRRIACEVEESRPVELVGLRLGKVAFVGMPGEVFAEYAIWLRGDSPFPYTMVLGNVGADLGYFPTETAFAEGGYEPMSYIYFCEQGYASAIESTLLSGARDILRRLLG